jgi:hypothetical protein
MRDAGIDAPTGGGAQHDPPGLGPQDQGEKMGGDGAEEHDRRHRDERRQ